MAADEIAKGALAALLNGDVELRPSQRERLAAWANRLEETQILEATLGSQHMNATSYRFVAARSASEAPRSKSSTRGRLDLGMARSWGLYISAGRGMTSAGAEEPPLYLVRTDGTLYFGSVQTMPFARPHFAHILSAIDYVVVKNYPARGKVVTLSPQESEVLWRLS